jgi:hypothetical protein
MQYSLMPFASMKGAGGADIRWALRGRGKGQGGIGNLALLDELVEGLRELPWRFAVDHCEEERGDLHVAVVAQDLARELDVGDTVHAGFYLQNSESGAYSTLACERVFRVVCSNGALVECEKGQTMEIGFGMEDGGWQEKLRTVLARSFSAEGLDVDLARFRATTQQMLFTSYEMLCNLVAQRLITVDEQLEIDKAFRKAADYTMYGLINAVTQVAHRLRASDAWVRAFEIERLGGEILRGDHNMPVGELAYR